MTRSGQLFSVPRSPEGQEGRVCPGRTDPSASRPARDRFAPPPRRAPPGPDVPVVNPGYRIHKHIDKQAATHCLAARNEDRFSSR